MASVNDTSRHRNIPQKRKLEDPTATFSRKASNKAPKLSNGTSFESANDKSYTSGKAAFVQDEVVEEQEDAEAGPELPPDDIEEEDVDEDDEGRFFGGGVTKQEREVIDFIDQQEDGEVEETIDLTWLKRTALNFERKINKNAELRAKYEDDPMKFVASEADLDAEIKGLSLLSEHPELYQNFVRSGCAASLTGLLAHENTDIAISVCEVLAELTDEDSGASEEQWNVLVQDLLKNDLSDLLVSNLSRLNEASDSDRAGVYHVLSVIENLLSSTANVETLGTNARLLDWLLSRIKAVDADARNQVGQNRQYAAEVLAILVQTSRTNRRRLTAAEGVDLLLMQLSTWRRKDPEKDSDEEEFAENLFDCLISTVKEASGSEKFLEAEGVELCLILLKEGAFGRNGAARLLDHATGGPQARAICERLVEAGGLKTLFTLFMKSKKGDRELMEHLMGIFSNMLKHLPGTSETRIRLLAKFVEKDYAKVVRLMELRHEFASKQAAAEARIQFEMKGLDEAEMAEMEDEWNSQRMDAGLFSLQTLDVILAWLIAEDDGVRKRVTEHFRARDQDPLPIIRASLQQQLDGIEVEDDDQDLSSRDMLQALIKCLE